MRRAAQKKKNAMAKANEMLTAAVQDCENHLALQEALSRWPMQCEQTLALVMRKLLLARSKALGSAVLLQTDLNVDPAYHYGLSWFCLITMEPEVVFVLSCLIEQSPCAH